MPTADFDAVFKDLRAILRPYAPHLVTVHDTGDNFYLDTPHVMPNKKPLFFGAVRLGRQYVSFHLMPVYAWPEMLDSLSPELRRRMQGKSCFNFKRPEPELFQELAALARAGFERYREHGYVS